VRLVQLVKTYVENWPWKICPTAAFTTKPSLILNSLPQVEVSIPAQHSQGVPLLIILVCISLSLLYYKAIEAI
jgi:hypothetical protein